MKTPLKWNEMNFKWNQVVDNNGSFMIWSDVYLIDQVRKILRGGSDDYYRRTVKNNPWNKISKEIGEEKTNRFIKIFCLVNNKNYEEFKKKRDDIEVTVSQFDKVFNEKISIKVDFKN